MRHARATSWEGRRRLSIALAVQCILDISTRNRPLRSCCIGRADISNASTLGKSPWALLVLWKVYRVDTEAAQVRSSSFSFAVPRGLGDLFPAPFPIPDKLHSLKNAAGGPDIFLTPSSERIHAKGEYHFDNLMGSGIGRPLRPSHPVTRATRRIVGEGCGEYS